MTLPAERTNAVLDVRDFLRNLSDPKKTPRVPGDVRRTARALLKHYPGEYDMRSPESFSWSKVTQGACMQPHNYSHPCGCRYGK